MKVKITRQRWAWYFVPAIVAATGVALSAWGVGADRKILLSPLFVTGLWLAIAWQTPKDGDQWTPITFANGQAQLLIWLFGCALLGIAFLVPIAEPTSPLAVIGLFTAIGAWLAVVSTGCYFIERRYKACSDEDADGFDNGPTPNSDLPNGPVGSASRTRSDRRNSSVD